MGIGLSHIKLSPDVLIQVSLKILKRDCRPLQTVLTPALNRVETMPFLGRCVNCNWACLGQFESEVKGKLRKHSEPRHQRYRYTVSRISKEQYYYLGKLWDFPQFWDAYNGKPPIFVEGAEAGS